MKWRRYVATHWRRFLRIRERLRFNEPTIHLVLAGIVGVIAMDVMRSRPPCLTPNLRLSDALPILLQSEQRRVPVVNNRRENKLIGSIVKADALGILSEAIAQGSSVKT